MSARTLTVLLLVVLILTPLATPATAHDHSNRFLRGVAVGVVIGAILNDDDDGGCYGYRPLYGGRPYIPYGRPPVYCGPRPQYIPVIPPPPPGYMPMGGDLYRRVPVPIYR